MPPFQGGNATGNFTSTWKKREVIPGLFLSAFPSFYDRAARGHFPRLSDRDDLGRLLATIAPGITPRPAEQSCDRRGSFSKFPKFGPAPTASGIENPPHSSRLIPPPGSARPALHSSNLREHPVCARDRQGPVADGERDPFGRVAPDVSRGEDPRAGGLDRAGLAVGQAASGRISRRRPP